MPAELDACVAQLMADGKDESSAFAICRAQLGVNKMSKTRRRLQEEDEEERDEAAEHPEDEEEEAAEHPEDEEDTQHLQGDEEEEEEEAAEHPEDEEEEDLPFQEEEEEEGVPPGLVKTITIAHAGKNLMNGDQVFDLTRANIDKIIENFERLKPQVPILLDQSPAGPDHVFAGERGGMAAHGWVNSLSRVGNHFMAEVKLLGAVEDMVRADQFRGVSIGAKPGRDLQGNPIGQVLDHLLVTNAAYFSDLNIAAKAAHKAGAEGLVYIQSKWKGKRMKKLVHKDGPKTKTALGLKAQNHELRRMVLRLEDELADARTASDNAGGGFNEEMEAMKIIVKKLQRRDKANQVLNLVNRGLEEGRLISARHTRFNRNDLDDVLKWFKASPYKGNMELLDFAVKHNPPVARLNTEYPAGQAPKAGRMALTQEQTEGMKDVGLDAGAIQATAGARNINEYKRMIAQYRKGA